jgi:hypothetical protein
MATEDQAQHEPQNQTTGDGNPEQHALVRALGRVGSGRFEGVVDRLPCDLHLSPDKLATDAFVLGDLSRRACSRQHLQRQPASLARLQRLGPTHGCLTRRHLQSRRRQIRIDHVCFLPETEMCVKSRFSSITHRSFTETDFLRVPNLITTCYPVMNQATFSCDAALGLSFLSARAHFWLGLGRVVLPRAFGERVRSLFSSPTGR